MTESYFEENIKPLIAGTEPGVAEAHSLFNLKGAGENHIPLSQYFACDITIGGMTIPEVGILVKTDRQLTTSKGHKTRLPLIVGCNLFRLATLKFIRDYGEDALKLFECPRGVDPLFFSCILLYYYSELQREKDNAQNGGVEANGKKGVGAARVASSRIEQENDAIGSKQKTEKKSKGSSNFPSKKKVRDHEMDLGGFAGKVSVGDSRNPICIPANSSKTVLGRAPKVNRKKSFMVESADMSNLPLGVGINNTLVSPMKSGQVSVILINNNSYNVWIRQPLYAGDLWEVDPREWEYEPVLTRKEGTNEIEVNFVQVPPEDLHQDILTDKSEGEEEGEASTEESPKSKDEEKPSFGPPPDFESDQFDFKKELERLPFTINIGEAPLTLEQQKRFIRLIYENQSVFSLYDGDLGFCDRLKHSIPTTTDKPVYLPHRQIPIQLQSEVRKCLDAWLKAGIIRPSKSPYASQVVIVRKKTGEICLCVDFRKLNAISIRDSFPLPRIEEALQAVQAAVWFTSFDLAQGYLQMAMEEEDMKKTAFRAGSSGLYEFTRMPFGLTNAGASFCCLMEMCIGDQQYITLLFYLDDICIFAETADQMLDRIQFTFGRLKEFSLKIKPKKSFFFQAEVNFLGHILSQRGVSPNPEKVAKIKDWPVPKTSKEVHSFVGLASYYRRFIPNFAKWAGPLHALIIPAATQLKVRQGVLKKSELPEFKWSTECQEGFDNLKKALTSAPILAYPDYSKPFILETDASLKGLGAVLSQKGDDNTVRVIAYASRSLRPGEKSMRDYSSAKIELLALKWSVCEKFKDYLLGSKFTVYTDNNPLVYVKSSKLGAAQIRWLSELALYDFDIVYRTGKSNLVADALSRQPESPNTNQQNQDHDSDEEWEAVSYPVTTMGYVSDDQITIPNEVLSEEFTSIVGGTKINTDLRERIEIIGSAHDELGETKPIEIRSSLVEVFSHITPDEMAEFQKGDNQISAVYPWVQDGKIPDKSVLYNTKSKSARKLFYQLDRLVLKQGVLHCLYLHENLEYHQLVLPQWFHSKVLRSVHDDMGHQGLERTMELLRERVYWPTMAADATKWVAQCTRCQVAQGNYVTPKPKIGHLEYNNPMDLLCLDFMKIDPSRTGKENVLVITDAFSKFSVAVVTPNQKALTVAKVLVDKWFHVYGIPARIHSDQGKSFDNDIIKALCKMYGVNQSFTCPYNPRGNAQCERFNRTMFGLLQTLSKEQKADWPVHLPALVFTYNATPHSTTGFQPYQLMFGRRAPAPCDTWLGLWNYDDEKSASKIQWVDQQAEQLLTANKWAMKNIKAVEAKNKRTSKGKDLDVPVGNLVLLQDHPEGRHKIQDRNKSELYVVVRKGERPNNFWIKPLGSNTVPKEVNR